MELVFRCSRCGVYCGAFSKIVLLNKLAASFACIASYLSARFLLFVALCFNLLSQSLNMRAKVTCSGILNFNLTIIVSWSAMFAIMFVVMPGMSVNNKFETCSCLAGFVTCWVNCASSQTIIFASGQSQV